MSKSINKTQVIGKLNNEYCKPASILNYERNTITSLKISLKGIILWLFTLNPETWRNVRERGYLRDLGVDWRIILN
jgi:hypothetical protein